MERILNILDPYFRLDFLNKVQRGNASNSNENLHWMIWDVVGKTKIVE